MQLSDDQNTVSEQEEAKRLLAIGFRFGDKGTHTSRTMMLSELSELLAQHPGYLAREVYVQAITQENCLGKQTVSTRRLTLQRLSELYALDPVVPLFRLLRDLWPIDQAARPAIALLCSLARDPLLKATAPVVLAMEQSEELARQQLTDAVTEAVSGRLNDSILDKVVRNAASSWTQSGHLAGRGRKTRCLVQPRPTSAAYALALGYMEGLRGEALLDTFWTSVFDIPPSEMIYHAMDAKRLGLVDINAAGGVTEISFMRLLTEEERRMIHGTN